MRGTIYGKLNERQGLSFNLQSHSFGLSLGRDFDAFDVGIDYVYNYMTLEHDDFLRLQSISPRIGYSIREDLYASVSYWYQNKDFRQEVNEPRDGDNHSAGFDIFYFFWSNKAYLQLAYRFEDENTKGDEYDYKGHIVNAALRLPAPLQSNLRLAFKYHLKDYDNITPSIGVEREDSKKAYNIRWTKNMGKYFELKMDYEYTDSDSNLESVDYTKNVFFIALSFKI